MEWKLFGFAARKNKLDRLLRVAWNQQTNSWVCKMCFSANRTNVVIVAHKLWVNEQSREQRKKKVHLKIMHVIYRTEALGFNFDVKEESKWTESYWDWKRKKKLERMLSCYSAVKWIKQTRKLLKSMIFPHQCSFGATTNQNTHIAIYSKWASVYLNMLRARIVLISETEWSRCWWYTTEIGMREIGSKLLSTWIISYSVSYLSYASPVQ